MNNSNLQNLFEKSLTGILEYSQITDLVSDYLAIEKMWSKFFDSMESINLVIVAEAPLSKDQYILNKDSNDTDFLPKRTLKKCISAYNKNIDTSERKKIDLMRDLGIIIIEAYPFSLDPKKHKKHFRNLGDELKRNLLNESRSWHLDMKLETIKSKISQETVFAFRYDCNKDVIGLIGDDLNFVNLSDAGKEKAHGKIDEDKLVNIFANFN